MAGTASDLIGDVSDIKQQRVPFHAVHELRGPTGSSSFRLLDCNGIKYLTEGRASVRIVSDSLTCQVISPPAPDKATVVHVAVIPDTATVLPTKAAHILTIGGSCFVEHSLYSGSLVAPLRFTQEVAHQIKPKPLYGEAPRVVYHFTLSGAQADTIAHLRISGELEVDGIGYVKTW